MTDDVGSYAIDLSTILFLILLNGLFAMSELAVVSSRKPRLKTMIEEGNRGARAALELAENPSRLLSTVQVGITVVGILSGVFGGEELAPPLGLFFAGFAPIAKFSEALAIFVIVSSITYAMIIIGELVPKHLGLRNPEHIASLVARPMKFVAMLAAPLLYVLEGSAHMLLRLLGVSRERDATMMEEEVKAVSRRGSRPVCSSPRNRR